MSDGDVDPSSTGSSEEHEESMFHELDTLWGDSVGEPLALFESDDPRVQSGTYVIQPDERVPESGTTSHGGPEISVILSGEVILGLPGRDETYEVPSRTLVVIPEGVEHYSHNRESEPVKLVYTVIGEL